MQRIFLLCTFFMMVIMTATSCKKLDAEGPVVTEQIDPGAFDGIQLRIQAQTSYAVGNDYKVEIESNQNVLDEIETYVNGNDHLQIRWTRDDIRLGNNVSIRVRITSPRVTMIELFGSGELTGTLPNVQTPLKLGVYGNGNIRLNNAIATTLDAEISGSGRIEITNGRANELDAGISGSGTIDMSGVIAADAGASINGSGLMSYPI